MKIGVSLPSLNQPWEKLAELARLADDAGLDAVWDYEVQRNPFVMHSVTAAATSQISLCTGIATTLNRTPFEMANAAMDVDQLSGGRMVLGIGPGTPGLSDAWHGTTIDHPAPRMREYIEVLRLIFHHLATDEDVSHSGRFYRFERSPLNIYGPRTVQREAIPIFLSAIRPIMTQLAGEIADGMVAYLVTPEYIRRNVLPNIRKGAERAGRDPAGCELASFTICSVSDDRAEAVRRARIQVGAYVAHPVSAPIAALHGVEDDVVPVAERVFAGDMAALQDVTSDRLVKTFSITGTPDEARAQIKEYGSVLSHIVLHPPYIPPFTQEETEDAFRNMVETFAR